MTPLLTAWLLGLVLGVRHAFEPDHLAAMATLVSTQRGARTALTGAWWGAGHALTLLVVGGALLLFRARMPAPLAQSFEVLVALMLLYLGFRALTRRPAPSSGHTPPRASRRPFLVGVAHGLAGSGALTALALAAMPSWRSALVYLVLFGAGSLLAMALASGLLGWPLERAAHSPRLQATVSSLAGVLSLATGLLWGWRSLFG
jgi:nickel/cobalt transporter (NicO) family protein